jgi:methionyl-tRNA formyltransferase
VKLIVAATAPFGAAVLEGLAGSHEVELLLTKPDRPRGRGRRLGPPPAKQAAERLGIPVVQLDRVTAVPGTARVVVVCAYGALIPADLLEERLWLNVHPSLLPRWRGAAPVERAIMAGDRETGVTIHRTTAELDAGPIAAQRAFAIGPEDDAGAVYTRAEEVAVELLHEVLAGAACGTLRLVPQPKTGVTYAEKIGAADRGLDWTRPVEEIVNRVRALSPHIGARGIVGDRTLTVWRARVAGQGAALVVDGVELVEVQPEGRRRMTGAEYLRGLRA